MAPAWHFLPAELRVMILERLSLPSHESFQTTMSRYAAVSEEWQTFFEGKIFHRLILHQSCIADFDMIVRGRRRHLVKHIWLRVHFPLYDCPKCKSAERTCELTENNEIFTAALCHMLEVLGSWKKEGRFGLADGGPVLELSMHSPSDSEHFYPDYRLDKHVYPHAHDEDCTDQEYSHQLSCVRQQGQAARSQAGDDFSWPDPTLDEAKLRLFGTDIVLDFGCPGLVETKRLPVAETVKGLLIRRQHLRGLGPKTLFDILECLPGIESMTFEHWRPCHPNLELCRQVGLADCLRWVNALKNVSIFEGHDIPFHGQGKRDLLPSLGWTLADESQSLEHLSVAFVTDAKDFFQDYWPGHSPVVGWNTMSRSGVQRALISCLPPHVGMTFVQGWRSVGTPPFEEAEVALWEAVMEAHGGPPCPVYKPHWANLESLAFTSQVLHPTVEGKSINDLLEAAAGAAMEMPKLRTMELWNGGSGFGCIFRYSRAEADACSTVSLRNTWGHELEPRVRRAWEDVANRHQGHGVVVEERALPREDAKFFGSVVELLELRRLVLHPVSLSQVKWEGEEYMGAMSRMDGQEMSRVDG
ncbi:hypothetical protein G6O67_001691 [Ophiocordyceps sinensis]|nr:hypothetical protein G6O67_001691 [Ophiocordyceps sinensis]